VGRATNTQGAIVIVADVFISMELNPVDPPISKSGFRLTYRQSIQWVNPATAGRDTIYTMLLFQLYSFI